MNRDAAARPAPRRTKVTVEVERRIQERAAQMGARIRAMRIKRRWTQRELGRRAELGRLVIGRLERGKAKLDVEQLERIAIAFGVPLAVGFDRDRTEDLPVSAHLEIQEMVLRHARHAGLERRFEAATRPDDPSRSSDVALASDPHRVVIDAECWNTFGDLGASVRSSRRKVVELEQLAIARWGIGGSARLVWIVRDTEANRAVMRRFPEVFASTFTGSSRAWVAALTTGSAPPDEPGLVWCDLSTGRLRPWNRRAPA